MCVGSNPGIIEKNKKPPRFEYIPRHQSLGEVRRAPEFPATRLNQRTRKKKMHILLVEHTMCLPKFGRVAVGVGKHIRLSIETVEQKSAEKMG